MAANTNMAAETFLNREDVKPVFNYEAVLEQYRREQTPATEPAAEVETPQAAQAQEPRKTQVRLF
jgi:hypothetical protein